jgi:hypothetical protein
MNLSSINGLPPGYLQSILGQQLTTNSLVNSPSKDAQGANVSPFAQLMSDATSNTKETGATASKAGHFLQQLMSLI